MEKRELRERRQNEVVVTEVICDRCGEQLDRVCGVGVSQNWEFKGAYVTGRLYPSNNADDVLLVAAELCAGCTKRLVGWINRGAKFGTEACPGARVRTAIEAAKEFTKSYGEVVQDG